MNASVEEMFVKAFIEKRIQDRIIFELSSSKNRSKAVSRFAHTTDDIINSKYVFLKSNKLTSFEIEVELIKHCGKNKYVYIISMNEFDGKSLPFKDALKICIDDYMPSIIICSEKVVFIKTEVMDGLPMKYILVKNSFKEK